MGRFETWVRKLGTKKVGRLLDTESPTVHSWFSKRVTPRPKTMLKLVKLGRGAFSLEDIIVETAK